MIDGEKEIIKKAISGEASAFGSLYDHYQPQIFRFIFLKVSHREEAEDLTHQVFLQGWRKIYSYDFRGFPFSSWLYRIARNEIIDYYRTKKNFLDLEEERLEEELSQEETLSALVDQNLTLEKVMIALGQLKPIDQDVIILRFVEDLSPQEIAVILEKTQASVRLLQHRAVKNLKKALNQIQ